MKIQDKNTGQHLSWTSIYDDDPQWYHSVLFKYSNDENREEVAYGHRVSYDGDDCYMVINGTDFIVNYEYVTYWKEVCE